MVWLTNYKTVWLFGIHPTSDMDDTETRVYRCTNRRAILLAFHGGCFMGGNSGWDAKQNTMLASMGFEVHQLAFPKSWSAWQAWARSFRWDLVLKTQPSDPAEPARQAVPVVCLGRSSGGYLACMFAAMHASKIFKLILMAPVLDPLKRASILVSFKANTYQFFETMPTIQPQLAKLVVPTSFDPFNTLLLLARKDENVPAWMFSPAQISQAVFPGPSGHVGLLGCTSSRLKQLIHDFVF